MSENTANKSVLDQISQQELHHLITVSTGFIDAYIIQCYGKVAMLLPQNIVLSALDSPTHVNSVEWHDVKLPVFAVNDPAQDAGVALVIEGDEVNQRFALMCNEMPKSVRVRISEVVDEEMTVTDPMVFQYVRMGEQTFQVPNMAQIQASLGLL
ncbi:hypothetical protein [Acinetobacter sp. GXMZU3951]|jgi:hypothetical protein